MTITDESNLDTIRDNVDQAIPLENLKQPSAMSQADNTINNEILIKDSSCNDSSAEDDVKFESTSVSKTNVDESEQKIDQTSSFSASREYHEPTLENDNTLLYCPMDEKRNQNDAVGSDSGEKIFEAKIQNISDDEYRYPTPGGIVCNFCITRG